MGKHQANTILLVLCGLTAVSLTGYWNFKAISLTGERQVEARQPAAELPLRADEAPAKHEGDGAVHFARAIQASDEAWSLCQATFTGYRPWALPAPSKTRFAELMDEAGREARLVPRDVLTNLHPGLPKAFQDFADATYSYAANARASRPDKGVQQTWARWQRWWQAYGRQIHLADDSRPRTAPGRAYTQTPTE
jgi:hypothetical protein